MPPPPYPLSPLHQRLYGNGQNESSVTLMVDPVTGQRLFCPTINKRRRPPRRLHGKQEGDVGGLDGNGGGSGSWNFGGPAWAGGRASEEKGGESRGKHVFSRLWEQSLALERRRKADAREREEARKARASERHVTGRYVIVSVSPFSHTNTTTDPP